MKGKFVKNKLSYLLVVLTALVLAGCAGTAVNAALPVGLDSRSASTLDDSQLPQLGEIAFKGVIDSLGVDSVVINGVTFRLDAQSLIATGLKAGDFVEIKGLLLPDQTRYALSMKLEDGTQSEFKFYGLVESISADQWVISGEVVLIDSMTVIDPQIQVGSTVEVEGVVLNGGLLANKISLEDFMPGAGTPKAEDESEFTGVIESIAADVWTIAGKTVMVTSSTEIKGSLVVGDLVKVHAALQADGTYLAREIEKTTVMSSTPVPGGKEVEFSGVLNAFDNTQWLIGSTVVMLSGNTEIKNAPVVGQIYKVHAMLQADGSYLAREIELEDAEDSSMDDKSGKPTLSATNDDNDDDLYSSTPGADDDSGDDDKSGSGGGDDDKGGSGGGGSDDPYDD